MYSIKIKLNDDLSYYTGQVQDYNGDVIAEFRHKFPKTLIEQISREVLPKLKPLD
jgi:hypothetical protein